MSHRYPLIRVLAACAGIAGFVEDPLGAQEVVLDGALVARYEVDSQALAAVASSSQLVQALRANLASSASMPLDEPLRVHFDGLLVDPAGGGAFPFLYSGLGYEVEGGQSVSGDLASLVRSSHGRDSPFDDVDWVEEAAWTWLAGTLAEGLTGSLAADGRFVRDAAGDVPLKVAGVQIAAADDWEVQDAIRRTYLRLQPGASFASSSDAEFEPPEGFEYDVQVLLIELEPGPVPETSLSSGALDGLTGAYDAPHADSFEILRNGDDLVGIVVLGGEPREFELRPITDTRFVSDIGGQRMELDFHVGDDGRATSITVRQAGLVMELPRLP